MIRDNENVNGTMYVVPSSTTPRANAQLEIHGFTSAHLTFTAKLKGLCQLRHIRSKVRLRLICIHVVAQILLFHQCKSFQKISQQTAFVITKERL